MKKINFFITLAICLVQIPEIFAQDSINTSRDNFKNTTTFGVKAGLEQTFVYSADDTFNRTNFYGSLFADTMISERVSLQYEIRYSSYRTHHFIEIPLLFKYHLSEKLNMYVGPRLDFFLNDNAVAKNFSLAAEFGIQYNLTNKLFLETAISSSFENQVVIDDFTAGTRTNLRVGIGYKF